MKLEYIQDLYDKYDIICIQKYLITSENFGLYECFQSKYVLIHEAIRWSGSGGPSGGTSIFYDNSLPLKKLES